MATATADPPRKLSPAEEVALQQAGQYGGSATPLTSANAQDAGLDPSKGFINPQVGVSTPPAPQITPAQAQQLEENPQQRAGPGPITDQAPVDKGWTPPDPVIKEPAKAKEWTPPDPVIKEPAAAAKEWAPPDPVIAEQPAQPGPAPTTPPSSTPPVQAPPPLQVPTPTPQSPTQPDPQAQVEALIAQGKSPGAAQALAAGQQPKTLSGAPPPTSAPKQPVPATTPTTPTDSSTPAPSTTTYIAPPLINGKAPAGFNLPSTQPAAPAPQPTDKPPAPAAPAGPIAKQPDGSDYPQRIQAVGGADPKAFIMHHDGGRETLDGLMSTLKERRLGVEYFCDRNAVIHQVGGPGAQNIQPGSGAGAGLNNSNIVGMEVSAKNDKDVTQAQKDNIARFIAARYPTTPIFGHGEVNPGHKEPDEGASTKAAIMAYRNSGGTVTAAPPTALAPVTAQDLEPHLGGLLKGNGDAYIAAGQKYNIDPKLLVAISLLETGHGTSNILQKNNNVAGLGGGSTSFKSIPESIEAEAKNLRENYFNQGLDTPEKIGAKWAPPGAPNDAGGNAAWPKEVASLYASLGGTGVYGGSDKTASSSSSSSGKTPLIAGTPQAGGMFAGGQPFFSVGGGGGGGGAPSSGEQNPPHEAGGRQQASLPPPQPEGGGALYLPSFGEGARAAQQPARQPDDQPQQQNPMISALVQRGFTPQQAASFAQSSQVVTPGKGVGPLQVGPAPPAPGPPSMQGATTPNRPPPVVTPKLLPAKQLMPGKPAPAAPGKPLSPAQPSQAIDPTAVLGLIKRGFTREQAIGVLSKGATVSQGIGETKQFRPSIIPQSAKPAAPPQQPQAPPAKAPAPPPKPASAPMPESANMRPLGYTAAVRTPEGEVHTGRIHDEAYKAAGEPRDPEFGFADKKGSFLPMDQADKIQERQFGAPPGSTHGIPNPKGPDAFAGQTLQQSVKQHAENLSPDDPRVKKQADGYIKGEHFVPGDVMHEDLLNKLPYGREGRQRGILAQAETAIADKSPMHLSYISAPKEAEKFPTRDSRKVQYDEHSPEARLMGTTEGQLVGHSMIPLNMGIKLGKGKEPHQSYIQGISTNVMANNFQHVNDKLTAMGRKSPYEKLGPKFYNDLEGYYSNLNAGHTATGSSYVAGTEHHPSEPDREHVPYKLSRKEADFIGTVINNTAAFAKHDDAKQIKELARVNGTLITEKGETNRLRHDIEQHEPGWRDRVLEPSIRTFKTGLIHEIHPSEEHFPQEIRPGKEYQGLTKAIARTSERGRPDIPIAASLHHSFADNKKINDIERAFSEHKIDEGKAREWLKDLGEDPEDYRFVGGSGGLITPYEDDPEALTPEEHNTMKSNLRQAWVGGKMNVEDYRKKSAEVPLPSKPSLPSAPKPAAVTPPADSSPVEAPEAPPVPKPQTPRPPKPPKPPKPQVEAPAPEAPETPEAPAAKQLDPGRVKNQYANSGDKVHWLPTDEVDKRWKQRDPDAHIPPGGTANTIKDRYPKAKEYLQSNEPVNAPRAHVDEKGGINIIDGRHRLAAMRDLGHDKVPLALVAHSVTGKQEAVANAKKTGLIAKAAKAPAAPGPGDPLPAKAPKASGLVSKPKAPISPPEEKLTKPKGAADEKWMADPKNEAERQAYLEKRVANTLKDQNDHPSAIPMKVQRNEAGGVQHDPGLNPVWEKTDYDIANLPYLQKQKKALDQIKNADKHEDTLGADEHKHLNDVQRSRLSAMREASAVHTMGDHILESYNKIKDQPDIAAGKGWYSRMREKMAKVFGVGEGGKASDDHELFAQLLGATSAKTPVRDNFIQTLDAFEQHKTGKAGQTEEEWQQGLKDGSNHHLGFNRHIAKYNEAYEALQDGGHKALNQKMVDLGILKPQDQVETKEDAHPKTPEAAMARWIKYHQITPLKKNGAKYNSNSDQVLKVLAGKWLNQVGAPKTPNFAGNLTGRTLQATIDVWAARHMHRIGHEYAGEKKKWRPQAAAEPGVNDLDFAFSQDAFKHAADKAKINPDDLQAILWYAEKHHWDQKGWTGKQGADKGSFDETWDKAFPTEGKAMTSKDLQEHYQNEKKREDRLDTLRGNLAEKRAAGQSQEKIDKYLKQHADKFLEQHGLTRQHLDAPPAAPGLEEAA